jgi:hypothetical protein
VTAAIDDHLPTIATTRLNRMTFDESGSHDTVEFSAFVLLRLDIGISASRYVLDGETTRLDHRTAAPAETDLTVGYGIIFRRQAVDAELIHDSRTKESSSSDTMWISTWT